MAPECVRRQTFCSDAICHSRRIVSMVPVGQRVWHLSRACFWTPRSVWVILTPFVHITITLPLPVAAAAVVVVVLAAIYLCLPGLAVWEGGASFFNGGQAKKYVLRSIILSWPFSAIFGPGTKKWCLNMYTYPY